MKITIDTKEDSKTDIKKVMQILSHFTDKEITNNYQEEPQQQQESSPGFMNMFGDNSTSEEKPDKAPDFSSFNALLENNDKEEKEEKEDKPKLQFF